MAKKTIHHMDFESLADINKAVVSLTREEHEYSPADGKKLRNLLKEVGERAENEDFEDAVAQKAALLVYDIARGQYFRAGNKRTALVAGLAFLAKNGKSISIKDPLFVETVDKAGIAAADLEDLLTVMNDLMKKAKQNRKSWDSLVKGLIEDNRDFLTKLAS